MAVDPKELYPTYYRAMERNNQLQDDITRKALDVPRQDDMQVTTNKGMSGWALVTLLLGGGGILSAAALVGASMLRQPAPPTQPADSAYEVQFFDQHGDPIYVPPRE